MTNRVSDRAIDCFTHGVAHLISELGTDRGLRKGIEVLEELAATDLTGALSHAGDFSGRVASRRHRPPGMSDGGRESAAPKR